MPAPDSSSPFTKLRNNHLFDPQIIHTDSGSSYIQNRIHRSHFMKMHLFRRDAMSLGLGFRQNPKDLFRKRQGPLR